MCLIKINDPIHLGEIQCGVNQKKSDSVVNAACIAQIIKKRYIKGNRIKHISPKFFSTHDLQKNCLIDVCQNKSSDNLTDLFTKSLSKKVFEQLS
jgi:hypothetical protein